MSTALTSALFHFLWQGAAIAFLLAVLCAMIAAPRARYAAACGAILAMPTAFLITMVLAWPAEVTPLRRFIVFVDAEPPQWSAVTLWMAGASLVYLYRFAGWMAVQRLRHRAVCIAPLKWRERLCQLARRIDFRGQVTLLESALAEGPLAAGVWRPVILMPVGLLTGLPTQQVEAILLHELAHIARRDYLVNLLQAAVEGLLFYHPAVWWVSRVIRRERELCCDDRVVAATGDPATYAQALAALEQHRIQVAMAATGGPLMNRMHRLLGRRGSRFATAVPAFAFLLVGSAAALFAFQPPPKPEPPPAPVVPAVPAAAEPKPALPVKAALVAEPAPKPVRTEEKEGQLPMRVGVTYQRATDMSVTANIAISFDRASLQFRKREDVVEAEVDLHLRLTTETGRRVGIREEPVFMRGPAGQLPALARGELVSNHSWTLAPGRYKLSVAAKDTVGETIWTQDVSLTIPELPNELASRQAFAVAKPLSEQQRAANEAKLRRALEAPYKNWLTQEVIWIIEDDERAAFQRLQTDQERQMFIEQFWQRRDPTPGTDENEVKEEHYRRIAWSNDQFASAIPGWKTDRGMIYVKYGAPDEKEEHPTGGPGVRPIAEGGGETVFFPYEKWRYRSLPDIGEVVIEFVDQNKTNDYRMTWNPNDKDALLTVPGAGLTLYERMGLASNGFVRQPAPTPVPPVTAPDPAQAAFAIGPQDVLRIGVVQDPSLSMDVVVLPNGRFSMPLIGTIRAAGLTPQRLQAQLEEALSEYINKPQVQVSVLQVNQKKPGQPPVLAPEVVNQAQQRLRDAFESPYKKWLENEADWIIVAERGAFPEVRRDTTPGTKEHEVREEHYRRIAWSNERFSEGTIPGFQSVRGKVYVRFGPPDKVEALEGPGSFANKPMERWQYSQLEGVGTDVALDFVKVSNRYKLLVGNDRPGEREFFDLLQSPQ